MENYKTEGLPVVISNKQITITLPSGKPASVIREGNENQYNNVLEAIKEGKWEEVVTLVDTKIAIESHFDGKFEVKNESVYIDGEQLPNSLSSKIIDFARSKLPVEPLLAFWKNLNENPSYRSVQQLYDFLEHNDHPITPDGCFIAYRRITNDFKDFYTGTMDNSIGATVSMKRNTVDEDPSRTCSKGLHVASYNYACNHYQSGEGQLVAVKVNPAHVVAVPTDYDGEKMRVCEFTVLSVIECEIKNTPLYRDDNDDEEEYYLYPGEGDEDEDEDDDSWEDPEDYDY